MKRIKIAIAFAVAAMLALSIWACAGSGRGDFRLTSFDVPETDIAVYGEEYEVPTVIATGSDGSEYLATVKVTHKGAAVELFGSTFPVTDWENYIVTYTVTANGNTYTATMTVKVVDANAPSITIGPIPNYEVGQTFVMPEITAIDDVDGEVSYTAVLRVKGSNENIEIPAGGYTFTSIDTYELVVSATDSEGNSVERVNEFVVRTKREAGEWEYFSDDQLEIKVRGEIDSPWEAGSIDWSLTKEEVGGMTPSGDGYFLKVGSAKADGSAIYDRIRVYVDPRFTREELQEWYDTQKYNAIQYRWYVEYNGDLVPSQRSEAYVRNFSTYYNLSDVMYYTDPPSSGNIYPIKVNEWMTSTFYYDYNGTNENWALAHLLKGTNYDNIFAGESSFKYNVGYIGGVHPEVTVYFDYIRFVNDVEVTLSGLEDSYTLGDSVALSDLAMSAKKHGTKGEGGTVTGDDPIEDAQFKVSVIYNGGAPTALTDGEDLTFEKSGRYTIQAELISDEYFGMAEKTVYVYSGLDAVKAEVARLAAEGNKTDAQFYKDLVSLRELYDGLTDADKAEYPIEDAIKTIWGDGALVEGKVWYYGSAIGLLQYNIGKAAGSKGESYERFRDVDYTTDGGVTGLHIKTSERVRFVALPLKNVFSNIKGLGAYSYIKLSMKAISPEDRSTVKVYYTDGTTTTKAIDVATGSWQTATIPVHGDSLDKAYVLICNGNSGSLPAESEFIFGDATFEYAQFNFAAPDFDGTTIDVGTVVSLDDFTILQFGEPIEKSRVIVTFTDPSENVHDITGDETYTLNEKGRWTLKATIDNEPVGKEYSFLVRTEREEGEIESFNDEFADYKVTGNTTSNNVQLDCELVKTGPNGEPASNDGYMLKAGYVAQNDEVSNEIRLHLRPRFTKAELQEWYTRKKFNALQIRWYVQYAKDAPADPKDSYVVNTSTYYTGNSITYLTDPKSAENIQPTYADTWMTSTYYTDYEGKEMWRYNKYDKDGPLDEMLTYYDGLFGSDEYYFLKWGSLTGKPMQDVTIYIDYIKFVYDADVVMPGLEEAYALNESIAKADLQLQAQHKDRLAPEDHGAIAEIGAADFSVTVTYGETTTALTDTFTFDRAGTYTITATINKDGYAGTVSKTVTVDLAGWTENKFDASKWENGYCMEMGTLSWSDLDFTMKEGDSDVAAADIVFTFKSPSEQTKDLTSTGGSIQLDEAGDWTLIATVKGQKLSSSYTFRVRTPREEGEIECFNDTALDMRVTGWYDDPSVGYSGEAVWELTPDGPNGEKAEKGNFLKFTFDRADGQGRFDDVVMHIHPRITKTELGSWISTKKYNALQLRWYIQSDSPVPSLPKETYVRNLGTLYESGKTTTYLSDPYSNGNIHPLPGNTWLVDTYYTDWNGGKTDFILQEMYDHYETMFNESVYYFLKVNKGYMADGSVPEVTIYVDYIRLVYEADLEIGATSFAQNEELTAEKLNITANKKDAGGAIDGIQPSDYKITVSYNGGDAVDLDGSYTLDQTGSYTVTATLVKDGYAGTVTKEITVGVTTFTATGFDTAAYEHGYTHETNEVINYDDVEFAIDENGTAVDDDSRIELVFVDPDNEPYTIAKTGDATSVTLGKPGDWQLKAKLDGTELEQVYTFRVRTPREEGEIECFNDTAFDLYVEGETTGDNYTRGPVEYSLVQDEVGGVTPGKGGYFLKTTARKADGDGLFPRIRIKFRPRFTAAELAEWSKEGKYNALQIRWYVDYQEETDDPKHVVYNLSTYFGTKNPVYLADPPSTDNIYPIEHNKWMTSTFYFDYHGQRPAWVLPELTKNFDAFFGELQYADMFKYDTNADATVYFDYFKLVYDADLEIGATSFKKDDTLTAEKLNITANKKDAGGAIDGIQPSDYKITVSYNGGNAVDLDGSYTLDQTGTYTVTATLAKDIYTGTVTKDITVYGEYVWTENKFDGTKWPAPKDSYYEMYTGTSVAWKDLDFTMTDGEGAVDANKITFTFKSPSENVKTLTFEGEPIELDEAGNWTIGAKVDGTELETTYSFLVRTEREEGEIESFNDEYAHFKVTGDKPTNDSELDYELVKTGPNGETASNDGYFLKTKYTNKDGVLSSEVRLHLRPRFTKKELQQWYNEKKFNALQVRWYVQYGDEAPATPKESYIANLATLYNGVIGTYLADPWSNTGYHPVLANTWMTETYYDDWDGTVMWDDNEVDTDGPLAEMLEFYDGLFGQNMYYFLKWGTNSHTTATSNITIYIDYIKFVYDADVAMPGLKDSYLTNESISKTGLQLEAQKKDRLAPSDHSALAEVTADDIDVTVTYGGTTTPLTDSFMFDKAGEYTITATIDKDGYAGTLVKTVKVDAAIWTENTFDATKWAHGYGMEKGTISWSDHKFSMHDVSGKVDDSKIAFTFTSPTEKVKTLTSSGSSIELDETGDWKLTATVDEQQLAATYTFRVRTPREEGEVECFNDDDLDYLVTSNGSVEYSLVQDEVGGATPSNGGYFLKMSSKGTGNTGVSGSRTRNTINVKLRPRFTAAELAEWTSQGKYNALQLRWYIEFKGEPDNGDAWVVNNLGANFCNSQAVWLSYPPDGANGKVDHYYEDFKLNQWMVMTFYYDYLGANPAWVLPKFTQNFEAFFGDINNAQLLEVDTYFDEAVVYIDYIKLVNEADPK